jgi:porin
LPRINEDSQYGSAELLADTDKDLIGVQMRSFVALTVLLANFASASAFAEDAGQRAPASYEPKSLTEEAAGKDHREKLPDVSSPTDKESKTGIDFGIIYKGELSSVINGGQKQQTSYLENLDVRVNFDFNKLFGWKGASFFIYGLGDRGATADNAPSINVGDIQGTSNIQTASSQFILYEAWFQQMFFEDKVSLLVGLHDLNSEFYSADSAAMFFNATFGVGRELSQTGVHGPSIFPVASLAARVKVEPSENFYLETAVFNAQSGDPNDHEATHIRGFGDDGILSITEAAIINVGGRNSKYALGMWSYDRTFDSLADPTKQVTSKGSYALADIEIVKNFSIFAKYGRSSTESNNVGASIAAGLQWKNLFSDSWNDRLGFGMARAYLGAEYSAQEKANGTDLADSETALELSYRFEVLPWLAFQPDYQYVINPSGNKDIPDAQIGTLRVEISM